MEYFGLERTSNFGENNGLGMYLLIVVIDKLTCFLFG